MKNKRVKKEKVKKAKKVVTEKDLTRRRKKRKRRLAFFNILVLLVAGFLVFYFGWVKPDVEPGEYVVIFSKTSGFEEEIYQPGKFKWMWEGIIPGNVKYYKYKITQKELHLNKESKLPSGDIYSSILTPRPDFTYKIDLKIRYRFNKDKLIEIIKKKNGEIEAIDNMYKEFEDLCTLSIPNYLQSQTNTKEYHEIISRGLDEFSTIIEEHISTLDNSQYFIIDSVNPIYINFPDIDLYNQAKSTYLEVIKITPDKAMESMQEYVNYRIMKDTQIEGMEQLGRLLEEHPVLLEYLKIYSSSEKDFELLNPLLKN